MKRFLMSLGKKKIIVSLIFTGLILSMAAEIVEAADPKKRGKAYRRRVKHGTAEGVFMFGPIAGANRSNIEGAQTFDNDYKYGFHAGLIADFGVHPIILVEPQLLYTMKGVQSALSSDVKLNMNYIELRTNAKLMLNKNLSLIAGPYFGLLLSANASFEGGDADVKDQFSPFDFGLNAGPEYQFKNGFGLNLTYNLGLADINTNAPSGLEQPARTHNVMQLSLFYLF